MRRLLVAVVLFAVLPGQARPAAAQDPVPAAVDFSVVPETVALPIGRRAPVGLVVRNPTAQQASIAFRVNPELSEPPDVTVRPGSTEVVTMELRRRRTVPLPAKVLVVATVTLADRTTTELVKSIEVTGGPALDLAKVATLAVRTAAESLDDIREADILLELTNTGTERLVIRDISVETPNDVCVRPPKAEAATKRFRGR